MIGYYEPLTYIVKNEEEGFLLKTILHSRLHISRKLLSKVKLTEQGVKLNGERVYISVKVKAGDVIEVRMEEETSEDILPQNLPFDILYEDEHLLIVNKTSGIIVHPTHGHYTNTLANGVVHYWQERGERFRFRPIHRLDQETSGVLAIAKNPYVHQHVSEQMQAGGVLKQYAAVVYGHLAPVKGTVHAPIDRDPDEPHLRIVTESGYDAITHYNVRQSYTEGDLVELVLETGRTHQIRVHMKHIGSPLIGDKLYKLEAFSTLTENMGTLIDRHALHAERLAFIHPITNERVEFIAPLPEDISNLLIALEK